MRALHESLVYLLIDSPYSVSVTFAGVDGAEQVNAAIAKAFDAVLMGGRPGTVPTEWIEDGSWAQGAEMLDPRVHVNTALKVAYPDQPFPVFGAAVG